MSRVSGALVLVIAASSVGCSVVNREEYSLIVRKPAHVYRPLTLEEASALKDRADPRRGEPEELFPTTGGIPGLRAGDALHQLALEPFKPFAYCHLHQSAHTAESAAAVAVAPVEYPLCVATNVAWLVATSAWQALDELWRGLFGREPPPLPPLKEPERERDR